MPGSQISGNVIEFGRQDPRGPALGALLGAIRSIAVKRLAALADALYDNVDDALFDLAERSGGTSQMRFFDGMREIRRRRQQAHGAWLDLVARNFAQLERPDPTRTRSERPKAVSSELELVEDHKLEEEIAIAAMSEKAQVRLNRVLHALETRLTHLLGGRAVDASNNPVGPRLLSEAFGESLSELTIDLEVKLIVFKLFERHVLGGLEPVYEEMNAVLLKGGVLPEMRYQPTRRQADAAAPSQTQDTAMRSNAPSEAPAPAGVDGADDPAAPTEVGDPEICQLLGELTQLLRARRGVPAASPSAVPVAQASPREMLNALSLLQVELGATASLPAPPSSAEIKSALLAQIGALSGGQRPVALGANEDMIDIVGMIFDYAVQDRNLPAPIAALLGRLQIPYLKVALLDRSFIARPDHPARRLLDEMAQAAIGWTEESDRDGRLIGQIRSTVERLNRDFQDDVGIFKRLLDEFQAFLESNRKRAELSERRTAETARGREKLDLAQRSAAQAIMLRIAGRELPVSVREILTRRWSNYLVLTHLRHGEESEAWDQATRFVEDIAWSVQPKQDEAERQRLTLLRPDLESCFRQGMQALGLHPNVTEEMWAEFDRIYDVLLSAPENHGGATPAVRGEVVSPDQVAVHFASTRPGEEVVISRQDLNAEQQERLDNEAIDAWLEMARALKAGTWMEFIKDDGTRERAKLLWISTIRALYLFVNRNGVKIAEKTAQELAKELREQRAVILEQVALVDRALDAIVKRLREPGEPKSDGAAAAETDGDATPKA